MPWPPTLGKMWSSPSPLSEMVCSVYKAFFVDYHLIVSFIYIYMFFFKTFKLGKLPPGSKTLLSCAGMEVPSRVNPGGSRGHLPQSHGRTGTLAPCS